MITLKVENMSCGHCVNAVTKAVQAVDAQASVAVDLATKTVQVTSDASREQVVAAIQEAGYPVVGNAV
ncbi:cation transporter [uncultured Oxalicibacterium sp.]|uniref:heavy-metal-associated domain-containing protein n=1 Tax=uncultured Oxalicibacterium sp. TaxID=1168540 RepID=UPI0025EDA557|nr:cation transporter [uncultured Oxalicibacterium sp.]